MGLKFLSDYGANRVRDFAPQPFLLDSGLMATDSPDEVPGLDYEVPPQNWEPREVGPPTDPGSWPLRPRWFVDGKDVGRTIAWLQSREGYPVPVRLSQIGAVVLRRDENGNLIREYARVERVVSFIVDLFPWEEVESFAIALQEQEFRLLPAIKPPSEECYDFERMRKTTQNRSNDEMTRLEVEALAGLGGAPAIVDGRLEPRRNAFDSAATPVVGLIKTQRENYLHPRGWQTYYQLKPGERTPAFRLDGRNLSVVSWYLRLDGANGELPNWGVVRIEVPERFFSERLGQDWTYLDRISRLVCAYRCRDQGYNRAAVSIHPIQRAEEKLGAIFTPSDTLISRFYRLTSL